jgi:hypothetical protein
VKTERGEHPRIARAIRELEDAIRYMEAAPTTSEDVRPQRLNRPVRRS